MFKQYKDKIYALEQEVQSLRQENETLKSILPRKKLLSMYSYKQIVRIAERDYGIDSDELTKSEIIFRILEEEKRLNKTE